MERVSVNLWPIQMCVCTEGSDPFRFRGPQDTIYPREELHETTTLPWLPEIRGNNACYSIFYLPTVAEFDITKSMLLTADVRNAYTGAAESGRTYDASLIVGFREIPKKVGSLGTAAVSRYTSQFTGTQDGYFRYLPLSSVQRVSPMSVEIPANSIKHLSSAVMLRVSMAYQTSTFYQMERILSITLEGDAMATSEAVYGA